MGGGSAFLQSIMTTTKANTIGIWRETDCCWLAAREWWCEEGPTDHECSRRILLLLRNIQFVRKLAPPQLYSYLGDSFRAQVIKGNGQWATPVAEWRTGKWLVYGSCQRQTQWERIWEMLLSWNVAEIQGFVARKNFLNVLLLFGLMLPPRLPGCLPLGRDRKCIDANGDKVTRGVCLTGLAKEVPKYNKLSSLKVIEKWGTKMASGYSNLVIFHVFPPLICTLKICWESASSFQWFELEIS